MAGHYQKRGADSYLLVYPMGYDQKGKKIRKTRTVKAKNKTEASKELAKFIAEIETGSYFAPSHTRFAEYVEIWRKDAEKKVTPMTIETYDYILKLRIIPAFKNYKLDNISHIHINDFLEKLKKEELASSTIQKHYNVLNSIFKLAERNETIQKNPMKRVDKPSVTYKPGKVYNSSELKELYQLLQLEENKQMVLLVKLALKTGMRKGEILALQWKDVDFNNNTIFVQYSLSYTKAKGYQLKEPKTKNSVRMIGPPTKLMKELKAHKVIKDTERMITESLWENGQNYYVFSTALGKPFFPSVPYNWWTRFLNRTGFKKIRFHDLRHTAATDLINRGANIHSISKRIGHGNISITADTYGHYMQEADQKIVEMLDEDDI